MKIYRSIAFCLLVLSLVSCGKSEGEQTPALTEGKMDLVFEKKLDVPEPSDLAFMPGNQSMLTVSDRTAKVYEIALDGEIIRTLNYAGSDLEGVCFNDDEQIVAVVEERSREVVLLTYPEGNEISRYKVDVEIQAENKGLEGISYSSNNKMYYIVNEDLPAELMLWSPEKGVISRHELGFAGDYSAISVDDAQSCLWILSDESAFFCKCDYKAIPLLTYKLPNTKFEGIAVDNVHELVYLVNDGSAKLSCYHITY